MRRSHDKPKLTFQVGSQPDERHGHLQACLMMKKYLLLLSVSVISLAHAQESISETQSIRCSALAHIHTVIITPPAFNDAMTNMSIFNSEVYAAFQTTRTGSFLTNGQVYKRRDFVEAELRETWKSKPEAVVNEMALCNSWRAAYAGKVQAYMAQTSKQSDPQAVIRLVGSPPGFPAAGQVEKLRPIVSMAFQAWAQSGSKTGGELNDEIRQQLKQKLGAGTEQKSN